MQHDKTDNNNKEKHVIDKIRKIDAELNLISEKKTLDPVQNAMGILGRWQIIITIALSLINFPAAWRQMSSNFLAPPVNFTCTYPIPMNPNDSMLNQCTVRVNENITEACTNFTYDQSIFQNTIVFEVINN